MYDGGALIIYHIDEELKTQRKSLDEVWKKLSESKKGMPSKEFFNILSQIGGKELSDKYYNIVSGKAPLIGQ